MYRKIERFMKYRLSAARRGQVSAGLIVAAFCLPLELIAGSPAQADEPAIVSLPGGAFTMGSDRHHREEGPTHRVTVGPFRIMTTEVTNAQFRAFVEETGYVTTAERGLDPEDHPGWPPELLQPGSMVFRSPPHIENREDITQWWSYVAAASWRRPEGPGSTIQGKDDHPVVQVSVEDAEAYARWAGGRLPTEAEWEFAARGGIEGADYTWGHGDEASAGRLANSWQGPFPTEDTAEDGYRGTAPAGSFPPNDYGLFDMAGNVWEYTSDYYVPRHRGVAETDPRGPPAALAARFSHPDIGPLRVIKGGSWLCAPNFCYRYRPAARQGQEAGLGTNHIGFRVAFDAVKPEGGEGQ